jgi:hypothetical protein
MANLLDLVKKVKDYFNPESNAGNNFWSGKGGQALVKAQKFGENFVQNPLPRFQIPQTDTTVQKVTKNLANIVPDIGNSIIGKGILSPLTDVAQMGMSRLGGTSPTYDTMRSGAGRLGLQVAGKINPDTIPQYGTKYGFKQTVGNVAETALPILNAYMPKGGKQIVEQGIKKFTKQGLIAAMKEGFVQGGKMGAGFGLTQSLADNRNTTNNSEYAKNVALSTGGGAVVGAALGGTIAGLSHGAGFIFNSIKSKIAAKNPKLSSQQVEKEAVRIIKDKATKPAKWVSDLGSPNLIYNDNTGNWDVDPKWLKKQGGFVTIPGKEAPSIPEGKGKFNGFGLDAVVGKKFDGKPIEYYLDPKNLNHRDIASAIIDAEDQGNKVAVDMLTQKLKSVTKFANEHPQEFMDSFKSSSPSIPIPERKGIKISNEIPTTSTPNLSTATEIPNQPSLPGIEPQNKNTSPQINAPLPNSTTNNYQDIIDALKTAKPLNAEQQAIYHDIKVKQAGALGGIQSGMSGEKGVYQQLSQLKGEMPKVEFESIKGTFTPERIDSLVNEINNSNLTTFEKTSASVSFLDMLQGKVPTKGDLALLNEVFPEEVIKAILDKRTSFEKLSTLGAEALNIPRAIMATADLSAPLRQGLFLIGRPKQWLPAFADMFKYAFSKDAYEGLNEQIKADPNYQLMRDAKLAITDTNSLNLSSREEQFMSTLPEKIPIFGKIAAGSNRAYTGFINKLRVNVFDDLINKAQAQGTPIDENLLKSLGEFVNTATGRGNLPGSIEKMSSVLNATLFSPRLMASRIQLLNPQFYYKLDPFVRKEALKSLFTFAGTAASVLALSKLGGAEVGVDPRSADFGKVKVGNTRYDILGGFGQYVRLGAQLITGKLISSTTGKEFTLGDTETYNPLTRKDIIIRFFESKEAPALSFLTALMTGKDAIGNAFDLPVQVVNRLIPMVAQDAYDLYKEKGPEGLIMALPGIFGVGVQTYGKQIPNLQTTPAGNPTIKLSPVPGMSEDIVNKIRGTPASNIPLDQQQPLATKIQAEKQAKVNADKLKQQLESGKVKTVDAAQVQSAPDLDTAKLFFKYSPNQYTQVGDSYLYKDDKGAIKTVDLKIIDPPKLTGDTNIDKSLKSKYNSAISTQISGVVDLYNIGALTQDQASQMVNTLTNQKISAPKAGKKISIAKVSVPKISYKLSASPKKKLAGVKIAKQPNLKPLKIAKIKLPAYKAPGAIKIAKMKGVTA